VREVLRALLISGVVLWASCVLAVVWVRSRLRRTLRIDPAVRSAVPTSWILAPTRAARLHRRLRAIAASARLASTCDRSLSTLAHELVGEALALEPRILAVAGTGRTGVAVRRHLAAELSELETAARRLASLSTDLPTSPDGGAASRLQERLGALDAARRELADIDLRAGLLPHP